MKAAPLISAGCIIIAGALAWGYHRHISRSNTEVSHTVKQAQPATKKIEAQYGAKIADFRDWSQLEDAYRYYRFTLVSDGGLQTKDQTFHLFGIRIPSRSQVCKYRDGERWACGQRAYIALLNFIGSTTVGCRPRDVRQPTIVICRLAGIDISEWMLRSGWAYLAKGVTQKSLIEAASTGFAYKVGMWAEHP
jgi:endonuclease YncB( thermonuclease family)